MGNAILYKGRTNHDTSIKTTVRCKITDRTTVAVTFLLFKFDKLTASLLILGAPVNVPYIHDKLDKRVEHQSSGRSLPTTRETNA